MTDALDGVLVVDKPEGVTSHDVVATVRRRLPRGTRVGHTGTLDPFATGVLPIVIGKATRLSQFLTASRKQYTADVAFGSATDTADRTGTVIATAPSSACEALTADVVATALAAFVGTHPQVPPAHSAKKIEGERAYVLARRGEEVTLPAVEVTAHALTLAGWDAATRVATVQLDTAAGYYVRSLARDLGAALGVPAHLSGLRRTASGPFTLAASISLGAVVEGGADAIAAGRIPLAALLVDLPAVTLDEEQVAHVRHGRPVRLRADQARTADGQRVRLLAPHGALVALARAGAGGHLHADLVLL